MSNWEEPLWVVNRIGNKLKEHLAGVSRSATKVPLDILAFAADYKMHGDKSYVANNKEYLHALYNCLEVSMNDGKLGGETLEFFIKENKVGHAFAAAYGIEHREVLEKLSTLEAVIGSEAAMTAVANSSAAMTAVLNSQTAMTVIADNRTAIERILKDTTLLSKALNSPGAIKGISLSATALNIICKSDELSKKFEYKLFSMGKVNLWNTLMNAENFIKEKMYVGDDIVGDNVFGNKYPVNLNSTNTLKQGNTINLIGYYHEDGDTTNKVTSLVANNVYINSSEKKIRCQYKADDYPGACFRGFTTSHIGGSQFAIGFYSFTAK